MAKTRLTLYAITALAAGSTLVARPAGWAAAGPQAPPLQQSEIILSISGESGARPR
jgi:hypothetical protein